MPTTHQLDRIALCALLSITVLGAALRWYPIGESLWLDELHTSWTVLASDGQEMAQRAQLGNNSTLYFRLVQCVTSVAGHHEWSLRIVSIFAGTALIPLSFIVSRHVCQCGVVPSLLAALLVCFDRHNNFYACEARTYALVQLVALGHVGLFILLLSRDDRTWTWLTWTWLAWMLTGLLLFHLHCTTALFLVTEALAFTLLIWLRLPVKLPARFLLMGFGVIVISSLSNADLLNRLAERRDNWSHFIAATRQPLRMLWLFPLDVYLLVPILSTGVVWFVKQRFVAIDTPDASEPGDVEQTRYDIPMIVCGLMLTVPVFVAWTVTELDITRIFLRRYLIASSVVLPLLTSITVSALSRGTWTRLLVATCVIVWGIPNLWPRLEGRVAEDWRAAIPEINQLPDSEPLIFYSGLIEADGWWNTDDSARREYCEFPLDAAYPLDGRFVILLPRSIAQIPKAIPLPSQGSASLLIRSNQSKKELVVQSVRRALGTHWEETQQTAFGRLTLVKFRVDPAANR